MIRVAPSYLLMVCIAWLGVAQGTESGNKPTAIIFNIAPQSLDGALGEFARQSGVQVIYDSELAALRTSPGVTGALSIHEALTRLLNDTKLVAHYTGAAAITIKLAGTPSKTIALETIDVKAVPLIGDDRGFRDYVQLLLSRVVAYLKSSDVARNSTYVVELNIWTDQQGRIEKVSIANEKGDANVGQRISEALITLQIGKRPPTGLPQPVRIRVTSQTPP